MFKHHFAVISIPAFILCQLLQCNGPGVCHQCGPGEFLMMASSPAVSGKVFPKPVECLGFPTDRPTTVMSHIRL